MVSIFNPYVLLGLVLAFLGTFYGGYTKGEQAESERQQLEIARLNDEARQKEQARAAAVNTTVTQLVKANNEAKIQIAKRDAACAAHRLGDDRRVAGNVSRHMAGEQAGVEVVAAAWPETDVEVDGAALEEGLGRLLRRCRHHAAGDDGQSRNEPSTAYPHGRSYPLRGVRRACRR